MATVYGVNKTKLNTPTGSNILDQGVNKGNVCYMYDTYEAASLAADSVLEVCDKLPAGAIITEILVLTDDLGGTATIDIGDLDDDDRYASAVDISGQAVTYIWPKTTAGANIANYGYQVGASDGDDQIAFTVNTAVITGTIKVGIQYSI